MKATELIKPEDLRRGNIINNGEHNIKVDSLEFDDVNGIWTVYWDEFCAFEDLRDCKPIELTEELLLRAGMEKDEAMFKMQHEEYEIKIMFYDCWRLFIDSEFESACLSGYWYFHDFQNIIKDLTGKELKLK